MRVLYFSYDGLTDPLGQSQILPYLCKLASKHSITILSFEKQERYKTNVKIIEQICLSSNIFWIPLKYHKTPSILSTLYDVWILKRKAISLIKSSTFDIVHCRSYLTSLVGLQLKRKYGLKFVFDMRGFWADERVDGGLWKLSNPIYKLIYQFFKRKELLFLNNSDWVVSLTENAKTTIESWGIKTSISVIPCCVDTDFFDPQNYPDQQKLNLRKELGWDKSHFVILYLGSLGTWYMQEEMMEVFTTIKARHTNAKFLILSSDHLDIENHPCKDSILIKSVNRIDVPKYLSIADLGLFFIKPTFSKSASSPTKMGELLAMKIPIICNGGWGDVEILSIQLKGLRIISKNESYVDMDFPSLNSDRAYVIENLSLISGSLKYENIYDQLVNH